MSRSFQIIKRPPQDGVKASGTRVDVAPAKREAHRRYVCVFMICRALESELSRPSFEQIAVVVVGSMRDA